MRTLTRSQRRAKNKRIREKRRALGFAQKVDAKPDWTAMRPEILKKSDGCYLCGAPLTLETMTTDHMVIEKMGAKKNDDFSNLMPCCQDCNSRKGSRRLIQADCICGQKYIVKGLGCLRCERIDVEIHEAHMANYNAIVNGTYGN